MEQVQRSPVQYLAVSVCRMQMDIHPNSYQRLQILFLLEDEFCLYPKYEMKI